MYEAAKKYSVDIAYKGTDFRRESLCLFMQQLDKDATDRMARFKQFMDNATQAKLKSAQEEVGNLFNIFKSLKSKAIKTYSSVKIFILYFYGQH
jgi:hypothetical protein